MIARPTSLTRKPVTAKAIPAVGCFRNESGRKPTKLMQTPTATVTGALQSVQQTPMEQRTETTVESTSSDHRLYWNKGRWDSLSFMGLADSDKNCRFHLGCPRGGMPWDSAFYHGGNVSALHSLALDCIPCPSLGKIEL